MKQWLHRIAMLGILSLFIFLTVSSAKKESLTFDEIFNLQEGVTNLTTRTFPIEPYNPPLIREIASIPEVFGFTPDQGVPNQRFFLNRLVIVMFGVILLWQVMRTANEYFGMKAALLSGGFLAVEPTFLAHSHYVTPDVGLTLFTFLAYRAFLNILISPTMTRYFFFGIFFGLACASKISALPFLLLSFLFVYVMKRKTFPLEWHMEHIGSTVFSLIVAGFVIWGTYFFRMTPILIQHDNPDRLSNKILSFANEKQLSIITQGIGLLQGTPVPLGDYLGIVKNNVLRMRNPQQIFFQGSFRDGVAWYMMPYMLMVKLSLPFLFFIFVGTLLLLLPEKIIKYLITVEDKFKNNSSERKEREREQEHVKDEYNKVPRYKIRVQYEERMDKEWNYLFIIPVVAILLVAIITRMAPLIRYILPAFPFLAIIAGSSIQSLHTVWKKVAVVLMLIWLGVITYSARPHFISYANEFIPSQYKYEYMMESNLDWGQGLISFQRYFEREQPKQLFFSYFGRDDASWYDFFSDMPWGSHKNDEICKFHSIVNPSYSGSIMTAISVSNWYNCGYYKIPRFEKEQITDSIADSILIFRSYEN